MYMDKHHQRTPTGAGWNPTPQLRNRAPPEDCRRLTSLPTTCRIPGNPRAMLNPIARPPSNGSRLTLHPGALFRLDPKKDFLVGGAGPGLRRDLWRGIGNAASAGPVWSPRARAPSTPWQWTSFPHMRSSRSRWTCSGLIGGRFKKWGGFRGCPGMHKARPVTLSPTGDARPGVAEPSPSTHLWNLLPSRPKTSSGASHLQGRGITRARLPSGDALPRSRRRTAAYGNGDARIGARRRHCRRRVTLNPLPCVAVPRRLS